MYEADQTANSMHTLGGDGTGTLAPSILAALFPAEVATQTVFIPHVDPAEALHPAEEALTFRMTEKRRREFAAGRLGVRGLLVSLGLRDAPLLMASDRTPIWPPEVVGCISHSGSYCGVAVARSRDFLSLGLDIERIAPLDEGCHRLACTQQELAWLYSLPKALQDSFFLLFFSAKECWYKCQYTVSRTRYYFHHVEIHFDLSTNEFRVSAPNQVLNVRQERGVFHGRYMLTAGYVFTGMVLKPTRESSCGPTVGVPPDC